MLRRHATLRQPSGFSTRLVEGGYLASLPAGRIGRNEIAAAVWQMLEPTGRNPCRRCTERDHRPSSPAAVLVAALAVRAEFEHGRVLSMSQVERPD
jgi:hypothetical protein